MWGAVEVVGGWVWVWVCVRVRPWLWRASARTRVELEVTQRRVQSDGHWRVGRGRGESSGVQLSCAQRECIAVQQRSCSWCCL